jgi:peptidoglycan/LPS O-acetylase OafA/YrhL
VAGARWFVPAEELAAVRADALATIGYVANWRMIYRGSGYFETTAGASPLRHAWSLGIEEQFDLLWPLAVVALRSRLAVGLACGLGVLRSIRSARSPNRRRRHRMSRRRSAVARHRRRGWRC